jgi:hypothetical protein
MAGPRHYRIIAVAIGNEKNQQRRCSTQTIPPMSADFDQKETELFQQRIEVVFTALADWRESVRHEQTPPLLSTSVRSLVRFATRLAGALLVTCVVLAVIGVLLHSSLVFLIAVWVGLVAIVLPFVTFDIGAAIEMWGDFRKWRHRQKPIFHYPFSSIIECFQTDLKAVACLHDFDQRSLEFTLQKLRQEHCELSERVNVIVGTPTFISALVSAGALVAAWKTSGTGYVWPLIALFVLSLGLEIIGIKLRMQLFDLRRSETLVLLELARREQNQNL